MFYKILSGVKVVEYGNLFSAPFCAKILADLGAEVIKIEEPIRGDDARRCEPFLDDIPGPERSGLFKYINMNKLGVTLNVKTDMGNAILSKLLRDADIFIENFSPKKTKELGITYEQIRKINPGIVMTSITPFGLSGPYKDYKSCELVTDHMSGVGYASTREMDLSDAPIKPALHVIGLQAGVSAVAPTLGYLYSKRSNGEGALVDVSEQESAIQNMVLPLHLYSDTKQNVSRTDRIGRAPFHILPCKDGFIYHAFSEEHQWRRFLEVMGNPDWGDNELFRDYQTRAQYWDALKPLILEWTMDHTVDEIYYTCQQNGCPVGAIHTSKEVLDDKQMESRDYIIDVEHPKSGKLKYPGIPYRLSGFTRHTPKAAPLLGQHNEEIYCKRIGYSKQDLVKFAEAGII